MYRAQIRYISVRTATPRVSECSWVGLERVPTLLPVSIPPNPRRIFHNRCSTLKENGNVGRFSVGFEEREVGVSVRKTTRNELLWQSNRNTTKNAKVHFGVLGAILLALDLRTHCATTFGTGVRPFQISVPGFRHLSASCTRCLSTSNYEIILEHKIV